MPLMKGRVPREAMLYLASRSPRRQRLLRALRRPFRVVASTHREVIRVGLPPSMNAMRNARGKALKARLPATASGIVIGADTFLYFRGRVIGKPRSLHAAHWLLCELSGRSHWVYTGLCLVERRSGRMRVSYARTKVTFRRLTGKTIARLLPRMRPLDKAGGYALQEDEGRLVARIEGSRSNVIGLPLERLRCELRALARTPRRGIHYC